MAKQSKEAHHWADATAERIVRQRGERDRYVLAAGITPSGTVHFGNMREIITPELVARALRRAGYGVRFIYLWDDYDRFRKVPANLPGAGWDGYIGAPLSEIPDPYGAASSYARHFAGVFEQQMARLGIEPEWISQAEMYGGGATRRGCAPRCATAGGCASSWTGSAPRRLPPTGGRWRCTAPAERGRRAPPC